MPCMMSGKVATSCGLTEWEKNYCLYILIKEDRFYLRHYAIAGVEPVLRSTKTAQPAKAWSVADA